MGENYNLEFKQQVFSALHGRLSDRAMQLKEEIQQAQNDANEETKSTAGDKYETGRAMIQLEIEKLGDQFTELMSSLKSLESLLPLSSCSQVRPGALVKTSHAAVFVSVNAGEVIVDGAKVVAISPSSPLAVALSGRSCGDSAHVNGRSFEVLSVV